MMTERPTYFRQPSADAMIRAVLAGCKTQMREVMKPQPVLENSMWRYRPRKGVDINMDHLNPALVAKYSPYGGPGDRLYWANEPIEFVELYEQRRVTISRARIRSLWDNSERIVWTPGAAGVLHGRKIKRPALGRWRGRRLPIEWACDWRLLNKRVWAERVQDISDADVVAEGVWKASHSVDEDYSQVYEAWADAWDSINAKRGFGWDANPWVWAIEFELTTKPKER